MSQHLRESLTRRAETPAYTPDIDMDMDWASRMEVLRTAATYVRQMTYQQLLRTRERECGKRPLGDAEWISDVVIETCRRRLVRIERLWSRAARE